MEGTYPVLHGLFFRAAREVLTMRWLDRVINTHSFCKKCIKVTAHKFVPSPKGGFLICQVCSTPKDAELKVVEKA